MHHPMMKLFISNRHKGSFQAVTSSNQSPDEATIYLYDMIVNSDEEAEWFGGVSPQSFIKTLNNINASTIHLRVNSPGGSIWAARSMEQIIREHKSKVIVHIDGVAASAASWLIMAADEIVIAPGAFMMIHNSSSFGCGNASYFRKEADLLEKIDISQAQSYEKKTGKEQKLILEWMANETWFSADEAVALGFADRVSEDKSPEAKTQDWDLSAFSHAPKPNKNESVPDISDPKREEVPPSENNENIDHESLRRQVAVASLTPV